MIIFDITFRHLSVLAQREPDVRLGVTSEGPGEFTIDLPWCSITFTDRRTAGA
ncbi:hypothetical protein MED193_08238 [Roseobacter sp. MED193]|uniref:hypothetical protein n=1 Tax=Roseobacter sp. MED193 TaxID=314262 RepID=UPI000068E06E|nr:hypothetical protein [Roseobacter sp. MED193]EAQ45627.1 hypothetical protein MED193_08238 [Roseobacter sp. MED193]